MEYRTCDEYVLDKLLKAEDEIAELNDFIEKQHKQILKLQDELADLRKEK